MPATGQELHALTSRTSLVVGPSFSSDGTRFAASWPDEGVVRVFEVASGRMVQQITTIPGPASTSFAPTDDRLAVASSFEGLKAAVVIDLETGEQALTLEGHDHAVIDVAWSPDGRSVATTGVDGSVRIFEASTGRQRLALVGHRSHVVDVDWSPDSGRIVTASDDGTAKVWTLRDDVAYEGPGLSAHDTADGLRGAAFAPDGARVVTGSADSTSAIVWDVGLTGGTEVATLPSVLLFYPAAAFAAADPSLFVTGPDGTVTRWDARTFRGVATIDGRGGARPRSTVPSGSTTVLSIGDDTTDVSSLAVDAQADAVATARLDGSVTVVDTTTGEMSFSTSGTGSLAWSPDGLLLAVAGFERDRGLVTVFDRSGEEVAVVRGAWRRGPLGGVLGRRQSAHRRQERARSGTRRGRAGLENRRRRADDRPARRHRPAESDR